MLVTLPFVLLLLDFWPLNRLESLPSKTQNPKPSLYRLLLEKIPFLLLSTLASLLTLWAQSSIGAMVKMETIALPERIANALFAYAAYLGKIFWPSNLAVFYPYEPHLPVWQFGFAFFVFMVITATAVCTIKKCHSYLWGGFGMWERLFRSSV